MIKVIKLTWVEPYGLDAVFSDGSTGFFDFNEIVSEQGPMIEPLRDPAFFSRVFLEFGAPTWPNGYDVAPGWLYREIDGRGGLKRKAVA